MQVASRIFTPFALNSIIPSILAKINWTSTIAGPADLKPLASGPDQLV
jgi:hypothetical protein